MDEPAFWNLHTDSFWAFLNFPSDLHVLSSVEALKDASLEKVN